ncbi:sugar O-acetyltransferase [Lactococcus formosensis]|jgi:maltose O-acetyltransferase|uniref:Acetyltransferase n=1 Tax=Lactococcus formosensis TaxID=1281486 RepID=A0A9X4NXI1_9LACT|nr:sugar O-acetyltransferase [Lactococcus formosensis]MCH1722872.1 sugar O-acetyltransferase [Lactococcus formosensis]MCO7179701.1 sugar O-acetyltransferase [Lactococcus formosensis]MDG6110792.1 sugar O-acetyltransferase [Lactococcus formosensis]MDG6112978.1 sugar O-acetyltransferase [Lactococcus formosensis]MDG6115012.1 sugar O-acetyltransferase [Lactococcus formosensis]
MSEYQRMISGQLYSASKIEKEYDPQPGRVLAQKINQTSLMDQEKIIALEKQLFGSTGKTIYVNPPLQVDYGFNTHIGENFYANVDCTFLDVAPITIGDDVMFGPRVSLITPLHPIDAAVRARGLEYAKPITIGNRVWLGAGVIVNPGVTIGEGTIVGSGAVVTKDLPAQVIAVGNPARVLREISETDQEYWELQEKDYYDTKKAD